MAMQHKQAGAKGARRRKERRELEAQLIALGGAWLLVEDYMTAQRLAAAADCRFQTLSVDTLTFCRYAPEREARMLELRAAWHNSTGSRGIIEYSNYISKTERGTLKRG